MNQRADAHLMDGVHDGLRRALASLPILVKSIADGDVARAATVSDHVDTMFAVLAAQFRAEDELLWPVLEDRAPDRAGSAAGIAARHQELVDKGLVIREQAAAWKLEPDVLRRSTLHTSLIAFERDLLAQFGHEDVEDLRVAKGLLTPDEFAAVEWAAWGPLNPAQRIVAVGIVLDNASPEMTATLLSGMDAPERESTTRLGRSDYHAYLDRVLAM